MLFHVTHTHTEHTCPINDPQGMQSSFGALFPSIVASPITLVGAWADQLAHQLFFVIDADDVVAIQDAFRPITDAGTIRIQPVADAAARVAELMES